VVRLFGSSRFSPSPDGQLQRFIWYVSCHRYIHLYLLASALSLSSIIRIRGVVGMMIWRFSIVSILLCCLGQWLVSFVVWRCGVLLCCVQTIYLCITTEKIITKSRSCRVCHFYGLIHFFHSAGYCSFCRSTSNLGQGNRGNNRELWRAPCYLDR